MKPDPLNDPTHLTNPLVYYLENNDLFFVQNDSGIDENGKERGSYNEVGKKWILRIDQKSYEWRWEMYDTEKNFEDQFLLWNTNLIISSKG